MPMYKCIVCGCYCEVPSFTFRDAEPPLCSSMCLYDYITRHTHPETFEAMSCVSMDRASRPSYRSGWEVLFADWLEERGIKFEYEGVAIKLGDFDYYLPDFYIPKTKLFIEIKGRLERRGKHKIQKALKLLGNSLLYLDRRALKRFKIL